MDKFKQVQEVITSVEADVAKFYDGGNAAAGTRVRKAMQDLKNLAQEIRAEVLLRKRTAQNKQETVLGN
ncbi:histone H1 [Pedobacter kyonggii]|uniref:Histone H1 n=1 Tax=Pedobacter kyonggii TaxID=1926871 RepID=A0A4Q9H3K3_9SPHI|nr:histone H1 [Pedobacter kyonggii]TBO36443.1 histone H1 [Pedobacter kyonggii]